MLMPVQCDSTHELEKRGTWISKSKSSRRKRVIMKRAAREECCTFRALRCSSKEEHQMKLTHASIVTRFAMACLFVLISATQAQDQHPILDKLANKVIQKYQSASCQDLQAKRAANTPPTPEEQRAIEFLKNDQELRTYFINKIAPPIANKLFDCGLIP